MDRAVPSHDPREPGVECRVTDWVYVGESRLAGNLKIGFSTNPAQRCDDLKCRLLAIEPGDRWQERKLHERFAKHRITGEWFKPHEEIWDWVKTLPSYRKLHMTTETTPTYDMDTVKGVLRQIQEQCWRTAEEHGWHEPKAWFREENERVASPGELIALIGSESSEMLEALRDTGDPTTTWYRDSDKKPEGVPYEGADVIVRVFDAFGIWGVDGADALLEKMEFNETRPYRHGNKHA